MTAKDPLPPSFMHPGEIVTAEKQWFVYMLLCRGGLIYTGIAVDVEARFLQHSAGRGAAFTRINKPRRILAAMECGTRSAALKTENALKRLSRPQKLLWAREQRWRAPV